MPIITIPPLVHRWRAAKLVAVAIAVGLATAGCGGSSTSGTPAPVTNTAQPASTAAPVASSRAAVVRQCAAQATNDPASLSLCLAHHHIVLPSGGKLVTCVQAAQDSTQLTSCLKDAVGG